MISGSPGVARPIDWGFSLMDGRGDRAADAVTGPLAHGPRPSQRYELRVPEGLLEVRHEQRRQCGEGEVLSVEPGLRGVHQLVAKSALMSFHVCAVR